MSFTQWSSSRDCPAWLNAACAVCDIASLILIWRQSPNHYVMCWFAFMAWHLGVNITELLRKGAE